MCIYLEITEKENSALFLKKTGREMERKIKGKNEKSYLIKIGIISEKSIKHSGKIKL